MPFDSFAPITPEIAVIDQMRELLSTPDKWCKHTLRDSDTGAMCLYGALNMVDHHYVTYIFSEKPGVAFATQAAMRVHLKLVEIVKQAIWRRKSDEVAAFFNNLPQTTHADILALLLKARESFEQDAIETTALTRNLSHAV